MPWDPKLDNSTILAIHAALVSTGQILMFGGDEHSQAQHVANDINHTRLYDPDSGLAIPLPSPKTDVFCAGEAFLADGRLLVAGGTETWRGSAAGPHGAADHFTGHRATWEFWPRARKWVRVADMRPEPGRGAENKGGGRWYPTLLTLADGQVLALSGHPCSTDGRHGNTSPERYLGGSWTHLPDNVLPRNDVDLPWYPRVHLLPDGTVFFSSGIGGKCKVYDPVSGEFTPASIDISPSGIPLDLDYWGYWQGTSVLLPLLPKDGYAPRVLLAGAVKPLRINLRDPQPKWEEAGVRQGVAAGRIRRNVCGVILPTGQVFLSGGVGTEDPEDPVREGEIYTPGIDWGKGKYEGAESWASVEPAKVTRNYHSVALLLPNGRVWTAGSSIRAQQGDPAQVAEKRIEIYRPPYDAAPGRPQLTSVPPEVGYGETFTVRTPQAQSIGRVALIRAGSVTHAFDSDQRYVGAEFTHAGGDRLTVTAPPHGGVAPPGMYTLWVLDAAGLPCEKAELIRIGHQRCFVVTDRSTFSIHEVNALLGAAAPAVFPRAMYVVLEGFRPSELGTSPQPPALRFAFDSSTGPTVPGLFAVLREVLWEDPAQPPDIAQRVTFAYDIHFTDASAYAGFPEVRGVRVLAGHGTHAGEGSLRLTHQPNPYMVDGDVSWLSVDLRLFQIPAEGSRAGIGHGSGDSAPPAFLAQLLPAFNAAPDDANHPFLDIPTDQAESAVEVARTEVNGKRVFNYAIAKVRYRAVAVPATDVKVFFRKFDTVGTALRYDTSTSYRRAGTGPATIPLLGFHGNTLASIPFFAAERVDTATRSMTTQSDPLNRRTLNPSGAQESVGYFGAWLDINQTTPQFPLHPVGDGPYVDRVSVQELTRGPHQCLVAEVFIDGDPIPFGATPQSNEDLSQRNLAFTQASNPGNPATRRAVHTFEIKPSEHVTPAMMMMATGAALRYRGRPDELMIRWRDLPPTTRATIFMPSVDADDVLAMAATRLGPPTLERVDAHTIRGEIGDVTFVPIPGGRTDNIPALFELELPEGVVKGDSYTVSVQQFSGYSGHVVGAFDLKVDISTEQLMLPRESRLLSVLRHIALSIPPSDRWYPVFRRYLRRKEDTVEGLGGDPDDIHPNPDGSGEPYEPEGQDKCCRERWLVPLIVAFMAVVTGTASTGVAAPAAAVGVILLFAAYCLWISRCRPPWCDLLTGPILGLAVAAGVLGWVRILGMDTVRLTTTLAAVALLLALLLLISVVAGCCGHGWCAPLIRRRPARVPRIEAEPPQ